MYGQRNNNPTDQQSRSGNGYPPQERYGHEHDGGGFSNRSYDSQRAFDGNHGYDPQSAFGSHERDRRWDGWPAPARSGEPGADPRDAARTARGPKGYQRADDRIREDVCDAIADAGLDASEVEVSVANGVVKLSGTVQQRRDKRAIEDVAEGVRGVQDVANEIRVARES